MNQVEYLRYNEDDVKWLSIVVELQVDMILMKSSSRLPWLFFKGRMSHRLLMLNASFHDSERQVRKEGPNKFQKYETAFAREKSKALRAFTG